MCAVNEPATPQHHGAGERLGEPERAHEVDREDALEILALCVEEQPQRRRAEPAGVVHEDVDGPDQRGRGVVKHGVDPQDLHSQGT